MKRAYFTLIGIILSFLLLIGRCSYYNSSWFASQEAVDIVPLEKFQKTEDTPMKIVAFVITKDNTVFKESFNLEDFPFTLGFRSSGNTFKNLSINKKYNVNVIGWRSTFWSDYRNLIDVNNNGKFKESLTSEQIDSLEQESIIKPDDY